MTFPLLYLPGGGDPPINLVLPVISGIEGEGFTLSTTDGDWDNEPTSYTYQWYADEVAIGGATDSTYELTASEVGATITVTVTATNGFGSASATSAPTGVIGAAINPVRVSQVYAEAIHKGNPVARVSQVYAETIHKGNPVARVSQVYAETLHKGNPVARVSQVYAEVIRSTADV